MNAYDRELPYDLDAERAVLGSLLLDAEMVDVASEIIHDAAAFWDEHNRVLWSTLVGLRAEGRKEFDGTLLQDRLTRSNQFDELGGYDYLARLIDSVPSSLRVAEYATIVQERYMRRLLIQTANNAMADAFELKHDIDTTIESTGKNLDTIMESRVSAEPEPLGKYFSDTLRAMEGDKPYGLQTKFGSWNRIIGGLNPEMLVLAARPSIGKTALALNLFLDVAIECNVPSVFFSLEMSREALTHRIISILADVPHDHIRRRKLDENDRLNIERMRTKIENDNLRLDDSKIGVTEICNRAKLLKRRHGVGVVYIDYLQLIRCEQPRGVTRESVVADMSHRLKDLSGILNAPVIVLAQLNRESAKGGEKPELHHLRESGAIEQDADTVVLLWDDPLDQPPPVQIAPNIEIIEEQPIVNIKAIVAKQRNGPRGIMQLIFDRPLQQFREGRQL